MKLLYREDVQEAGYDLPAQGLCENIGEKEMEALKFGGEWVLADGNGNVNIDSGTLYVDAVNDRVGIGTSSPSQLLEVENSSGNVGINITSSDAGYGACQLRHCTRWDPRRHQRLPCCHQSRRFR